MPLLARVAGWAFALLAAAAASHGGDEKAGTLCLAPFHIAGSPPGQPPPIGEPSLSESTWSPQHDSHFQFFVDGRLRATIGDGESAYLTGLPADKPIRVRIVLDGEPFESFSLELGKEPERRICLWLYPGYWHWIDNGWDTKLGCRCGEKREPARAGGGS